MLSAMVTVLVCTLHVCLCVQCKHKRLGAGSPMRRLSVMLLQHIMSFVGGKSAAGGAGPFSVKATLRNFDTIEVSPRWETDAMAVAVRFLGISGPVSMKCFQLRLASLLN